MIVSMARGSSGRASAVNNQANELVERLAPMAGVLACKVNPVQDEGMGIQNASSTRRFFWRVSHLREDMSNTRPLATLRPQGFVL